MSERLEWMAQRGMVAFELDFLRELGFEFGLDYDGEVLIDPPAEIDPYRMTELVRMFGRGIGHRLDCERYRRLRVCVGGPCDGQPHEHRGPESPLLFHLGRGRWAVYRVHCYVFELNRDPRAWFVGEAASKKKAMALWWPLRRAELEASKAKADEALGESNEE